MEKGDIEMREIKSGEGILLEEIYFKKIGKSKPYSLNICPEYCWEMNYLTIL